MPFEIHTVRPGAPSIALLAALVRVAQHDDPFAPCTVLVPDNLTGVMARRALAGASATPLSPARGVANVRFCTPLTFAAQVAGGEVPGRASAAEVAAAVRAELATVQRGVLAPVASHPATELALVDAYRALVPATSDTRAELAASPSVRTREVVAVVDAVRRRLTRAGRIDPAQLAGRALAALGSGAAPANTGALIVFLVDDLAPADLALVAAVAEHSVVAVVVAATGDPAADGALAWWGHHGAVPTVAPGQSVAAVSRLALVSATDSDDEVRHVVRCIGALADAGLPLARIAVLYAAPDPYARLVHEHLRAAGVPHNGPAVRTLAGMVAGRLVTAFFSLLGSRWTRTDVIDLLAIAPGVDARGRPRRVVAFDDVARAAGVIAGRDDWRAKLDAFLAVHAGDPPTGEWWVARALLAEVDRLGAAADALAAETTWSGLARGLREIVDVLAGASVDWPEAEVRALESVHAAIDGLVALDTLERPSLRSLERAVLGALEAPAQRIGRLGTGVQFGPIEHARALDADEVFIVGVAEGLAPAPVAEDTLLPDIERRLARHGELELSTTRAATAHRAFLVAVAAARRRCTVTVPRGDHRGGRTRSASRWLDPWLHGGPLVESVHLHSFADAMLRAPVPLHLGEARLRALGSPALAGAGRASPAGGLDAGVDHAVLAAHPLTPPALARAVQAVAARASDAFTEWDGNLAGCSVGGPPAASPTRLESYAGCAFRYYAGHVLRLAERESPDEIDQIDPRDRGSVLHRVLERFVEGAIEAPGGPPAPGDPWSAADIARLHAIATEELASIEALGRTGARLRWRRDQLSLRADLDRFIETDNQLRAARGATPVEVEHAFGFGGEEPFAVELSDGTSVNFRGRIDRIDTCADGSVLVIDYKSGKVASISADDPVGRGEQLQLPVYGMVAAAHTGRPAATAGYWSLREGRVASIEVDAGVRDAFRSTVTDILAGIRDGMFLARPGEHDAFFQRHANCRFCAFDAVCRPGRHEQWLAKTSASDPPAAVARYLALGERS